MKISQLRAISYSYRDSKRLKVERVLKECRKYNLDIIESKLDEVTLRRCREALMTSQYFKNMEWNEFYNYFENL